MLQLLIGVAIGLVLGLTGAGGSVLAMPLLLALPGQTPLSAAGLALGVVAASSLAGAVQRIRQREVLWIPALLFGSAGVLLAPPGRWLAAQLPDSVLVAGFAALAVLIAARLFWQSITQPASASLVRGASDAVAAEGLLCRFSPQGQFDWRWRCIAALVLGGVLTGLLSGMFGVGGGFLIVPFLNQLNGVSMRHAIATSLVMIAAVAGSGFLTHAATQPLAFLSLGWLVAGGTAGMLCSNWLARRLAGVQLQRAFAVLILLVALWMLWGVRAS